MSTKTWKQFNVALSWSTKVYILIAISIGVGAFVFNAWATNWAMTILITLALTLLVEYLSLFSKNHPKTWTFIKWTILFITIMLLFISSLYK